MQRGNAFRKANYVGLASGFSLIELLITIAVIGILFAVGAPMLGDTENAARRASQSIVMAQLQQARAHAISSGKTTALAIPSLGSDAKLGARAVSVFEVEKINTGYRPLIDSGGNVRMLQAWEVLPKNIAFLSSAQLSSTKPWIMDIAPNMNFTFKGKTNSCHSIVFAPSGQIIHPTSEITIAMAPAVNRSGRMIFTQKNGSKPNVTCLQVNRLTARVRSASLE